MKTKEISMKLRLISLLPALAVMIVIFIFSSKTATESSSTSTPIAEFALTVYESISGKYPEEIRAEKLDLFSHLVRKTAHISEYALLSFLFSFHFYIIKFKKVNILITSIILSAAYAATDEIHQLFIDGRSGQISDIFIDTIGALFGGLVFLSLLRIIHKIKRYKQNTRNLAE